MNELLLFASTFVTVFAYGLQNLNVVRDFKRAAFLTSYVIGAGNLFVLKLVPDAGLSEIIAYLSGGPFGMVASMHAHPWLVARWGRAEHEHGQRP